MDSCIFCGIEAKTKSESIVFEDSRMVAVYDIKPSAPVHILIMPKKHIASVAGLENGDAMLVGDMIVRLKKIAEEKGISKKGYKIVINTGRDGGQIIEHLHIHLLGGKVFAA